MKKHRSNLLYCAMQASFWAAFCAVMTYSSNYLKGYGFNDSSISLLLGLSALAAVVLQLITGEVVSRARKLQLSHVAMAMAALAILAAVVMQLAGGQTVPAIAGFALLCFALQTFPSFVNTMGVRAMQAGHPVHFGIGRGVGSLIFSLVSYLVGWLIGIYGNGAITVTSLIFCVCLFVSILTFRKLPGSREARTSQETVKGNFLRKYPRYALFLLGSCFLYFSHNLLANFPQQVLAAKGGGAAEQGITIAIGAAVEIPMMFAFLKLLKVARCEKWIKFCGFFFILRPLGIYLAPTVQWVYVAQLAQMFGFAIYTVASVYYASALFSGAESVRGQTYLSATITIGTLTSLFAGGTICQHLGAQAMVLISVALGSVGALLMLTIPAVPAPAKE